MIHKAFLGGATALVLATALFSPLAALPVRAQAPVILVINTDYVLSECTACKVAGGQLKARAQKLQAREKALSEGLRRDLLELEKQAQARVAAPEVLQAKQQEIQAKQKEALEEVRAGRAELQRTEAYVIDQISDALKPVIDGVRKERKADIVVNRGAVVWTDAKLEVTELVIQRLDASLKVVSTTLPAKK